ncbi:hypothetical protein [Spiroplasma turonicum]|uniref:Uncharacterized protein n=1 Tax=Spiroplasma turonicum TaxID=216946 RepID=A0A0K1P6S5_9MOLU|nr:hypothetical protein [Spiroplasma turonicum]AKU79582.1 hypothetical protein STURON_00336 [Spiroplasma turonicum]ALX70604.1 hypothetical protein STURO_v1c03360 [Spiroplasma turonicum]
MKLNIEINKFNSSVKKLTIQNRDIQKFINEKFNILKQQLKKVNINFKKMGDFAYGTYICNSSTRVINLDLAIISYVGKTKKNYNELIDELLNISKNNDFIKEIHTHKNNSYLNILMSYKNIKVNFRVISIIYKKFNKGYFYIINKNDESFEEIAIELQNDFILANKLSSGLLFSIKRLINYILKKEFNYTYNIDMLILRWFYEYICKSLDNFIQRNYKLENQKLNIVKFLSPQVFRKWIKNNISFLDLVYFIFIKWDSQTTFYFKNNGFINEEMFEDISRWSHNTYSTFNLPKNYISRIRIFDSSNQKDRNFFQNNLSDDNGFSEVVWSNYKNEGHKYLVTPLLKTGIPNFIMFKKWLVSKSNNLYTKLNPDLQSEIKTTKTREAISELNTIANAWLTKYNQMLKYLQPFFDKKYGFFNSFKIDEMVDYIIRSIDKIESDDWEIKNYF